MKLTSSKQLSWGKYVCLHEMDFEKTRDSFKGTASGRWNEEVQYTLNTDGKMMEDVLQCNANLDVSPHFTMAVKKTYDPRTRNFEVTCNKTIAGKKVGVTMYRKQIGKTRAEQVAAGPTDDKHCRMGWEMNCEDYGHFAITADRIHTNRMKDLDMTLQMKMPIKKWQEPRMKFQFTKKNDQVNAKMECEKGGKVTRYFDMNVLSDYDIATNLIPT